MKPALQTEHTLINAIIEGRYPPGTRLPAERELAKTLGVTRPTLRETLSRLHRDGWLTIQHGKATLVNDYWSEGGLNVLSAMVRSGKSLNPHFISWLLTVRRDLAPAYTRAAVEGNPEEVIDHLANGPKEDASPTEFSAYDWTLHRLLTRTSGNPIYTLILNGFEDLYQHLGAIYFAYDHTREASRLFYQALAETFEQQDPVKAQQICLEAMNQSLVHWQTLSEEVSS